MRVGDVRDRRHDDSGDKKKGADPFPPLAGQQPDDFVLLVSLLLLEFGLLLLHLDGLAHRRMLSSRKSEPSPEVGLLCLELMCAASASVQAPNHAPDA